MKDMLDRMKKHKAAQKEREEMQYPYSGSDEDTPENNVAGEPSSILQAPGENTLRKNFQVKFLIGNRLESWNIITAISQVRTSLFSSIIFRLNFF